MLQDTTTKAKYMLSRVDDFKVIFKDVFKNGIPSFRDEQGFFLLENEYQEKFQEKRNDVSIFNQLLAVIKGRDLLNVLERDFNLLYIMKRIVLSLPPISYLDADNRETLAISFLANIVWKRISTFTARWT